MNVKTIIMLLFTLFWAINYSQAARLEVPSPSFPDIQTAIDSAQTGDTVLVQPGTYPENINFNGKNILVASLYFTLNDTSYITQTIIDGSGTGSVVTYENAEDSSAQLIGFTIRNGATFSGGGGGVYCINGSNPTLRNLKIRNNSAANGGGIFCFESSPQIEDCWILNNTTFSVGGGIYASKKSEIHLKNTQIIANISNNNGGGLYLTDSAKVYCDDVVLSGNITYSGAGIYIRRGSEVSLTNTSVLNNYALDFGGAVYSRESQVSLNSSFISRNEGVFGGGGIYAERSSNILIHDTEISRNRTPFDGGGVLADNSSITLRFSTIKENGAGGNGGGIYSILAELDLQEDSLSNIYTNFAGFDGSDLYFTTLDPVQVPLDTFSVSNINDYYVYPRENIAVTYNAVKTDRVNSDLYVSVTGNNLNDGLSAETPLRSISYALLKTIADSLNPVSVYIAEGTYSLTSNDEFYPLRLPPYVFLKGSSTASTRFDAAYTDRVVISRKSPLSSIENVTITQGLSDFGAGIYLDSSNIHIQNVLISQNIAGFGSAIYSQNGSTPFLLNSTVVNNKINTDFFGTQQAGGLYSLDSDPAIINSIFWENELEEISLDQLNGRNNLVVLFSNIQDSLDGIQRAADDSVYWLDGNINTDPLFSDTSANNFTLLENSPCIDAGTDHRIFYFNNNSDSLVVPELDFLGSAPDMGAFEFAVTGIISDSEDLPNQYKLYPNFPNPFNPETRIRFSLPVAGRVKLEIFNISGQRIQTIVDEFKPAGMYEVYFNAKNRASGLYFYRLNAGSFIRTGRMILIK